MAVPQTSIGDTSMTVPQTSIGSTSGAGYSEHEDPYANAPMTSMGTVDELEELLDQLKLGEYLESFRAHGFDEVATVAAVQESELRSEIGMKFGHARKLRQHFDNKEGGEAV